MLTDALANDFVGHNLTNYVCNGHNLFGDLGKQIGFTARLASISRVLGTDHYIQLDEQLLKCIEKLLHVEGKNLFITVTNIARRLCFFYVARLSVC